MKKYKEAVTGLFDAKLKGSSLNRIEPVTLRFSAEAFEQWKAFQLEVEEKLREGGEYEYIQDWAGKLPGVAARIAGIFHCIENVSGSHLSKKITAKTIGQAIELVNILSIHALVVFDLMGASDEVSVGRNIWKWIEKKKEAKFTKRDCYQCLKGQYSKVIYLKPGGDGDR